MADDDALAKHLEAVKADSGAQVDATSQTDTADDATADAANDVQATDGGGDGGAGKDSAGEDVTVADGTGGDDTLADTTEDATGDAQHDAPEDAAADTAADAAGNDTGDATNDGGPEDGGGGQDATYIPDSTGCAQDKDCPDKTCFWGKCSGGKCGFQQLGAGSKCDDGVACTTDESCDSKGFCVAAKQTLLTSEMNSDNGGLALAGAALSNGNVVQVGRHGGKAHARVIDAAGKEVWSGDIASKEGLLHSAVALPDGNAAAVGEHGGALGYTLPWIGVIGSKGTVLYADNPKTKDYESRLLDVALDGSKHVVAAGQTSEALSTTIIALFVRMDVTTGKTSSLTKIGSSKAQRSASAIAVHPGGGWVMAGYGRATASTSDENGWLTKVSDKGNVSGEVLVGEGAQDRFYDVSAHPSGGFVAAGGTRTSVAALMEVWVVRTDDSFKKVWSRKFGTSATDVAWWVRADKLGAVIAGEWDASLTGLSSKAFFQRIDNFGTQQWMRVFGTHGRNEAGTPAPAKDGYWLSATLGTSDGKKKWAAIRVDAYGHGSCLASGGCLEKGAAGCDDGKPCTQDDCGNGQCLHGPLKSGTPCADGKSCNVQGQCT